MARRSRGAPGRTALSSQARHPVWRWLWLACYVVALPALAQEATEKPVATPAGQPADQSPAQKPSAEAPAGVIKAIEFSGNRVTRRQILLQEMVVKVGDPANPQLIERSRQAIMDLGLFVWVHARVASAEGGVILHIEVKEKYYILPVPKLDRDAENRISLGMELTLDNLGGYNQQLKYRYENQSADGLSGGKINTDLVSYSYPRMFGSPYNFQAGVTEQTLPAEGVTDGMLTSLYRLQSWTGSFTLSRWLNRSGPSTGWQVGGGAVVRTNRYEYLSGAMDPDFISAKAVGITLLGQYVDVHDYLYSRSGVAYGYNGEYGDPTIGSDTHYTRHLFYYRRYWLLPNVPHENLDLQTEVGLSSGDMFPNDVYAYALGGNSSLRGYDSGAFTGNAYVLLNVQYLRPLFGYFPLRGVLFADIGNAYPSNQELHLGDLHWDAGVGLRLRLKSFVKIDLRVDVAYARDTGEVKVFAGSKELF
jgi:outer membrane protein assembly factor BamA